MAIKDTNKQRALDALTKCTTFTEAAAQAGISRKTLYNYLQDDTNFAKAYRAALERASLERYEQAAAQAQQAQAVILDIMQDREQPAALRLKAAESIIKQAQDLQIQAAKVANDNAQLFNNLI